jgi:predicted MPP superfamily phosphohydrolase
VHAHPAAVAVLAAVPEDAPVVLLVHEPDNFFENGRHLIVSGGCSWWPVRFGVPPEIVLVDIAAQATATTRRSID